MRQKITSKVHTVPPPRLEHHHTPVHKGALACSGLYHCWLSVCFVLDFILSTHTLHIFHTMKLSNLVLIFAAVTEARKVGVGSRWEKKQGLYVIKVIRAKLKTTFSALPPSKTRPLRRARPRPLTRKRRPRPRLRTNLLRK